MAHIKKFTDDAVCNQLRHIERTILNSSNPDIDRSRTHLDYILSPDRDMTAYDYYLQRKSELYCYNRSDVKTLAGWVVTAPKELPESQQAGFFEEVYRFMSNRYGEKNCIEAVVHLDESSPHMHYCFIPVAPDAKHGGEKICCNEVINPRELRNFHPDLQKWVTQAGYNVKVHSGVTRERGGNRSVRELKAEREERKRQYTRERRF